MIAQNIINTQTTKAQQAVAQAQQPSSSPGFLSLLSTTDSTLTDMAQNTGATIGARAAAAVANSNKSSKNNDPTATPYIAAPVQAVQDQVKSAASGASNTATNAINAAANAATAANASGDTAPPPAATPAPAGGGTGNNLGWRRSAQRAHRLGRADLRFAQPTAAMATMPAHLLRKRRRTLICSCRKHAGHTGRRQVAEGYHRRHDRRERDHRHRTHGCPHPERAATPIRFTAFAHPRTIRAAIPTATTITMRRARPRQRRATLAIPTPPAPRCSRSRPRSLPRPLRPMRPCAAAP